MRPAVILAACLVGSAFWHYPAHADALSNIASLDQRCQTAVREFSPYKGQSIGLEKDDWGHVYRPNAPYKLIAEYVRYDITGLPEKSVVMCVRWPDGTVLDSIFSDQKPLFCGEKTWSLQTCHEVFDDLWRLSDSPKYREATVQSRIAHFGAPPAASAALPSPPSDFHDHVPTMAEIFPPGVSGQQLYVRSYGFCAGIAGYLAKLARSQNDTAETDTLSEAFKLLGTQAILDIKRISSNQKEDEANVNTFATILALVMTHSGEMFRAEPQMPDAALKVCRPLLANAEPVFSWWRAHEPH